MERSLPQSCHALRSEFRIPGRHTVTKSFSAVWFTSELSFKRVNLSNIICIAENASCHRMNFETKTGPAFLPKNVSAVRFGTGVTVYYSFRFTLEPQPLTEDSAMFKKIWTGGFDPRHHPFREWKGTLNSHYFSTNHPGVYAAALRIFGSWSEAVSSCGLDYNQLPSAEIETSCPAFQNDSARTVLNFRSFFVLRY